MKSTSPMDLGCLMALVDCEFRPIPFQDDPMPLSIELALVGRIGNAEGCRSLLGE